MKISVATIQMQSLNNDYSGNQARAQILISQALSHGARLILLPELALAGYEYDDDFWKAAEPLPGPTSRWLSQLADRYGAYLATCILELDGSNFYDTFILCGPGGQLWTHRKVEPAGFEAFYFRGAQMGKPNPSVFETPLGRIGVAICFDASKSYSIKSLAAGRPDILLMPFSCPSMPRTFPEPHRSSWIEAYKSIPVHFAHQMEIPVITSNKTGTFYSPMPMGMGIPYQGKFIDQTAIIDRDGVLLSSISGEPGLAYAELDLAVDPDDPSPEVELPKGRWFIPLAPVIRLTSELTRFIGMIRYSFSINRRRAASRLNNQQTQPKRS